MPSAGETTYLIEVMQDPSLTSPDSFTSHDVDMLVSRIKKNLRLSGLKSRSSLAASQKLRASPYALPSRTCGWSEATASTCELCSAQPTQQHNQHHRHFHHYYHSQPRHQHHRRYRKSSPLDLDDSYERFQALLRSGALIKEAVKRLQTIPDDELADEEEDNNNNSSSNNSASKRRATSTSATSTTLDSMDEEDEDEDVDEDDFVIRRKHFDYDSEDEPIDADA